jgi:hypothetical protein
MKTQVQYLIHPNDETRTVFALFTNLKEGSNTVLSYETIGQHSECSLEYADECYEAAPDQYETLHKELTTLIGYELEVTNEYNQ